jgi:hypothetical protein
MIMGKEDLLHHFDYCSTHNMYYANESGNYCPACSVQEDWDYEKEQLEQELEDKDSKITDLENRVGDLEDAIRSTVRDIESAIGDLEYNL